MNPTVEPTDQFDEYIIVRGLLQQRAAEVGMGSDRGTAAVDNLLRQLEGTDAYHSLDVAEIIDEPTDGDAGDRDDQGDQEISDGGRPQPTRSEPADFGGGESTGVQDL